MEDEGTAASILQKCLESGNLRAFEDNSVIFARAYRRQCKTGKEPRDLQRIFNSYLQVGHQIRCLLMYLDRPRKRINVQTFTQLLEQIVLPSGATSAVDTTLSSIVAILEDLREELQGAANKWVLGDDDNCYSFLRGRYDYKGCFE